MSNVSREHERIFGKMEPEPPDKVKVRDLQRKKSGVPTFVPFTPTRDPDDLVTEIGYTLKETYTIVISPYTNEVRVVDGDVSQNAGKLAELANSNDWDPLVKI